MNKNIVRSIVLTSCISLVTLHAFGAEDGADDATVVTYDKAYFEAFTPVTLLDMLQSVPGVPDILNKNRQQTRRAQFGGGGGQRGFGSGGDQILMDGKRLAGKSNNIDDTLSRVSASQVDRIELIRGAASGLDVQSQGLVINIIMLEGANTSTTFWQIKGEYSGGHDVVPEFLISHSGSMDSFDYSLSYERKDNDFFFDSTETFLDSNGDQTAVQTIAGGFGREGHKFNTNLAYGFEDGSRLRLNGLYEPNGNAGRETRSKTNRTLDPIVWDNDRDFGKWEVGGDYSRSLGVIGNLKSLFVISKNTEDAVVNRFKGSGIERFEYTRDLTNQNRLEKIFRGSVTKSITAAQSIEIGGEAAINTFDKTFDSLNRDIATDPLLVGNSDNVEIKENRYEVFANHSYTINTDMVLQSSLTTEFSKIVADNIFANGDISRRDTNFTYLKPRVNFRYDYSPRDQFRLLVEKKVSQLNFNNFVTRFDQQEQVFRFGNTNIRPEQTWDFAFTYEHRLPNDTGSLEGEIFYRKYTDHISFVDFTEYVDGGLNPTDIENFFALNLADQQLARTFINDTDGGGSDFTSKSGNINSAKGYGFKLKSNLRLGFIGVPQATLSVNYTYERRRTTDQFTGLERNFERHSDHRIDINFRHDITEYQFTYGFETTIRSDDARYNINSFWPNQPAANVKVFAEKTILDNYKLRLEGEGLTRNRGASRFIRYTDHIRLGENFETQLRVARRPVEIRVSLQGTF